MLTRALAALLLFAAPAWADYTVPEGVGGISHFTTVAGELYESGAGTTITVVTAGTYYQWVSTTAGSCTGTGYAVCSTETDDITIGASGTGTYLVVFGISASGSANSLLHCSVFKEGVELTDCEGERKVSSGGDVGNFGSNCLAVAAANDSFDLRCTSDGNGNTVVVQHVNLSVVRVAD